METIKWVALGFFTLGFVAGATLLWLLMDALRASDFLTDDGLDSELSQELRERAAKIVHSVQARRAAIGLLLGLVLIFVAGIAVAAPAQPLAPIQPRSEAEKQEMVSLYVRTRMCMWRAHQAMLRFNITDKQKLLGFASAQCGGGLITFLVNTTGWTRADATALVNEISERELNLVLGITTL